MARRRRGRACAASALDRPGRGQLRGCGPAHTGARDPTPGSHGPETGDDARTGVPPGMPGGAMCVQRFDDSLSSAIHTTYRSWPRSSSTPEPRDPLLKVLFPVGGDGVRRREKGGGARPPRRGAARGTVEARATRGPRLGNDPSAGSPTETLLRLLLPLNDQV